MTRVDSQACIAGFQKGLESSLPPGNDPGACQQGRDGEERGGEAGHEAQGDQAAEAGGGGDGGEEEDGEAEADAQGVDGNGRTGEPEGGAEGLFRAEAGFPRASVSLEEVDGEVD